MINGFLSILLIHIIGNRFISIPIALVFFPWYIAMLIVFCLDIIQFPIFYFLYQLGDQSKWLRVHLKLERRRAKRIIRKIRHRPLVKRERKAHANIFKKAQKWGQLGVIFITGMPFMGGGIWSGVLLAKALKLSWIRQFILIMIGSLLSCFILSFGFGGLKELIIKIFS